MGKRAIWAWVAISLAYTGLGWYLGSHLTFFWDDYDAVLAQISEPIGFLLKGSAGHWAPLSRALLFVETKTFGLWYPGYLMVNAALLATSWLLLGQAMASVLRRRWGLWLCGGIVYLTALGVIANIAVASNAAFMLSMFLAAAAALALVSGRSWWQWGLLLGASWIAMSGLFVINAALVAGVWVVVGTGATSSGRKPWDTGLYRALLILITGAVGTAVGYVLAAMNPTDYYARGASTNGVFGTALSSPLETLASASYLLATWIPAPLVPSALARPYYVSTAAIFFAAHTVLFWGASALVTAALLVLVWRQRADGVTVRRAIHVLALLLPAALWALMTAVMRPGNLFSPRYVILWLAPIVLCWLVVLSWDQARPSWTWVNRGVSALLVVSAAVALLLLPTTSSQGTSLDRARWTLSAEQRSQLEACLTGGPVDSSEEIAPTTTDEQLCEVARYLAGRSPLEESSS